MSEKIALLEFVDEAKSFLDHFGKDHNFLIIALQPDVQIYLKNIGVKYENTLNYISNESHSRAILKCDEWFQLMSERLKLSDGSGIEESYNNSFLFSVYFYINHFLMYSEILFGILEKHDIDSIYATTYKNEIQINSPPIIQENERYLGQITKRFSEIHNIYFHEIPSPPITNVAKRDISSSNNSILENFYRYIFNKHLSRKNVILLTSAGYNLTKFSSEISNEIPEANWVVLRNDNPSGCIKELIGYKSLKILNKLKLFKNRKGYNFNLRSISMDVFQSQVKSNTRSIDQLETNINHFISFLKNELYESFNYNKINFIDVFIEKIEKDLKPNILHLHLESEILKKITAGHKIKLVISPFARWTSLLLAEVCESINIPRLMISHGTTTRPRNRLEEIENYHIGKSLILSELYNNTAIQSPSELKHLQYYNSRNNLIITGPQIFSKSDSQQKERLKNKILSKDLIDKKILLYPENIRSRYNLRFHVFETFDEFLSSSIDLVNAVNEIEDVHLIFRLHPGRKISPDDFRSLLPESNKLTITSSERPLSEMLSISDLLINFSSTVIEDALQNYIPVLLYDKRDRYKHFDSEDINCDSNPKASAVYYVNDPSCLKEGLQWVNKNHLDRVADIDNSIFDEYVFPENHFNNIVEFISKAING